MDEELEKKFHDAFGEDATIAQCMKPEHMEQGADFEPYGSVKTPCHLCGELVWAAPGTMELLARSSNAHVVCCCCTDMHSMADLLSGRIAFHAHEYDDTTGICGKCGLKKDLVEDDMINAMVSKLLAHLEPRGGDNAGQGT
jgi:hypothetical protein